MYDVEVPVSQAIGRRPLQSMPEQVQEAHGDPPVDAAGAPQFRSGSQPVFPGAGEDRQIHGAGGINRGTSEQRCREFVRELASARAAAECRPIVDEDPQTGRRGPTLAVA